MTRTKPIRNKPAKPRPDWPLTPSSNGHWVKKIRGKVYNFGRWEDPDKALSQYVEERDYIQVNGCRPIDDGGIKLGQAVVLFLQRQKSRRDGLVGKKISPRHYEDQLAICGIILRSFTKNRSVISLRPSDFTDKLYKSISRKFDKDKNQWVQCEASTILRNIANVKAFFNWLAKEDKIPHRINFGADFVPPEAKTAQDVTSESDWKQFTAAETWKLIEAAPPNTKAMIWLALNASCNNADCANLTKKAVDFKAGVLRWKRWKVRAKKYAKVRTIPLWPETLEALRKVSSSRPEPKDAKDANLFFLTRSKKQWSQWSLSQEVGKLKKPDKLDIDKPGIGFNSFRHVIETFGGTDQVAIDWLMGHIDKSIAVRYRDGVPRERVQAVLDNVRSWLGESSQ